MAAKLRFELREHVIHMFGTLPMCWFQPTHPLSQSGGNDRIRTCDSFSRVVVFETTGISHLAHVAFISSGGSGPI